jgi:3-mercaptopyruvate sulfurtransferase SseA
MARQFTLMGYPRTYALKGGWNEWVIAGFPTEPK